MISVIIPVYNEESQIVSTIQRIRQQDIGGLVAEIIVCDAGSQDQTLALAASTGAKVLCSPKKGRAAQMNFGAANAALDILYFLHADTVPPAGFSTDIVQAIKNGAGAGCFTLAFDHHHWYLEMLAWFTRFDIDAFRYGDQSLFIKADIFKANNGFREDHIVMEDQDLVKRVRRAAAFKIIPKPVITSARKYLQNGIFKTQNIFFLIYFMYKLGYSQERLLSTYRNLIRQDKL